MRRLALLFLLLAYAPKAHAQCQVGPSAILQLQTNGRPHIPVVVENRTAIMLFDSGAETSSIIEQAAEMLRLPLDSNRRSLITTLAGRSVRPNVLVNHLVTGPLDFGRQSLTVMPNGGPLTANGQLIAGIIGMNLFGAFDIQLDLARHVMALYPPAACIPAEPPWPPGSYETLEVTPTQGHRILLPVQLDSRRLTAMLDTGADAEVLTRQAAERIGMGTVQIDNGQISHGIAAGDQAYTSRIFHFDTFSVGGEVYRDVTFPVADFEGGGDMILGVNWMQSHRLFISGASHRLFVQRNDGAPITPLPIAPDVPKTAPIQPQIVAAAPVAPARVGAGHCAAPVNLLPILARESLQAVSRPRLQVPASVQNRLTEGCAGAAFRVAEDGTVHDVQILTEWPTGYGLGDYVRQELEATRFEPPEDGMQALHYEAHNLHPK